MSQITINEKNFARFARRLQKLINESSQGNLSLGQLQSQELFSQILGSENVHELRANLRKESEHASEKSVHFKLDEAEVKAFFQSGLSDEHQLHAFAKKIDQRSEYIVNFIAEVSGYEIDAWSYTWTKSPDRWYPYTYDSSSEKFKQDFQDNIGFSFELLNKKMFSFDKYITQFPTTWLYCDFEDALKKEAEHDIWEQKVSNEHGKNSMQHSIQKIFAMRQENEKDRNKKNGLKNS
jgi:hypothetical protein